MIVNFSINGIRVEPEHGHWKLSKDGYTIRCDCGEINTAIPEFEKWIEEQRQTAILFHRPLFLYKKSKRRWRIKDMKVIKKYDSFNARRYGNPWVALVNKLTGKIDFSQKIGGYTGGYNKGEAGELYIVEPVEGAVYAYGRKDYRGNGTEMEYIQYVNGVFIPVDKTELINKLND